MVILFILLFVNPNAFTWNDDPIYFCYKSKNNTEYYTTTLTTCQNEYTQLPGNYLQKFNSFLGETNCL